VFVKNMSIRMKILLVFGFVLVVNFIIGGIIFYSSLSVDKNVGWTVYIYEVLESTDVMMVSMVD
jgi:Predicted periplasmic ligand-binding sensor domain